MGSLSNSIEFDDTKKYEYTDNLGNKVPKLSRREKAQIEKEQEKQVRFITISKAELNLLRHRLMI